MKLNRTNHYRLRFAKEFARALWIVWPVLSGIIILMISLGWTLATTLFFLPALMGEPPTPDTRQPG